jgi:hypothetical protein
MSVVFKRSGLCSTGRLMTACNGGVGEDMVVRIECTMFGVVIGD